MRVLTLFARHGAGGKYAGALDDVRRRLATVEGIEHRVLVIDNAPDAADHDWHDGVAVRAGSNESWEFSAWDTALQSAAVDVGAADVVHFCTSAFGELYTAYLDRVNRPMLEWVASHPAALGHIDYYNEPVELFGMSNQRWLRSSYVFVQPARLRLLGPMTSLPPALAASLFGGADAPFAADAPLSQGLRDNIVNWLTGAGTGQGVQWHSTFAMDAHNVERFRAKTTAILNEQLLTMRLDACGCTPVDVTWLATRLAAGERVGTAVPWQRQLIDRDVDSVPAERFGR